MVGVGTNNIVISNNTNIYFNTAHNANNNSVNDDIESSDNIDAMADLGTTGSFLEIDLGYDAFFKYWWYHSNTAWRKYYGFIGDSPLKIETTADWSEKVSFISEN